MAIVNGDSNNPHAYQRGMILDIYQNPHGNFSNKGVSTSVNQITVSRLLDLRIPHTPLNTPVPADCRVFAPIDRAPEAVLVLRNMARQTLLHVCPTNSTRDIGQAMMGGCYVATSDSRWTRLLESLLGHGFYGALPLHDRWEF